MKIQFYSFKEFEKPYLEAANKTQYLSAFTSELLSLDTVGKAKGFEVVCVFTGDDVSDAVLDQLFANGTRYIAVRAAGYDNIDLRRAAELGIKVANVPEYSPYAIAEHALALILALNRKLVVSAEQVRRHNFTVDNLIGFDLHKKTVGIIGAGKIGCTLIKLLQGFDCRIIAHDIFEDELIARKYRVEYMPLAVLCEQADIVSVHTCLTPQTKYLINKELIKLMKPGVMLINTGRGACINTEDVISGLESGRIGYFGADVYEKERGVFFYDWSGREMDDKTLVKLMNMPNVLITPHQAFATREALQNIADTTYHNISCWAAGRECENELPGL